MCCFACLQTSQQFQSEFLRLSLSGLCLLTVPTCTCERKLPRSPRCPLCTAARTLFYGEPGIPSGSSSETRRTQLRWRELSPAIRSIQFLLFPLVEVDLGGGFCRVREYASFSTTSPAPRFLYIYLSVPTCHSLSLETKIYYFGLVH